jgi:hypothetical protein
LGVFYEVSENVRSCELGREANFSFVESFGPLLCQWSRQDGRQAARFGINGERKQTGQILRFSSQLSLMRVEFLPLDDLELDKSRIVLQRMPFKAKKVQGQFESVSDQG